MLETDLNSIGPKKTPGRAKKLTFQGLTVENNKKWSKMDEND